MFETCLLVENISVIYDNGVRALDKVTLSVKERSITAIIGANGAGKSTLLRTIAGILTPVEGNIYFQGKIINSVPAYERVNLGICLIPEGRGVFPYMTVQENLEMGAYMKRARSELFANLERVFQLFPRLAERRKQLAISLSGGEQQMLAIGRGLMSNPKLLMLDEPSLGLAPKVVEHIFEVMEQIYREGVNILLVEQHVELTLEIAHEAYVIESGKITMRDSGKNLLMSDKIKEAYLGL
jgi:branched-chain amino acid transport system ATP-binding protein